MNDLLPDWAIGTTDDPMMIGAQLCTRDGSKVGNAVTVGASTEKGLLFAEIVTDAGTRLRLNESELHELFHVPQFLMDPTTAPGVQREKALATSNLLAELVDYLRENYDPEALDGTTLDIMEEAEKLAVKVTA